jgi:hypothetical protein
MSISMSFPESSKLSHFCFKIALISDSHLENCFFSYALISSINSLQTLDNWSIDFKSLNKDYATLKLAVTLDYSCQAHTISEVILDMLFESGGFSIELDEIFYSKSFSIHLI